LLLAPGLQPCRRHLQVEGHARLWLVAFTPPHVSLALSDGEGRIRHDSKLMERTATVIGRVGALQGALCSAGKIIFGEREVDRPRTCHHQLMVTLPLPTHAIGDGNISRD